MALVGIKRNQPRRLAIVQHRHPPARGLLSLISLLRAFPLTGINRNQSDAKSMLDCRACLALRGGVMTGDAYLFGRLGGFSGGVSLAEPLLPASSLTRNTRNTRSSEAFYCNFEW